MCVQSFNASSLPPLKAVSRQSFTISSISQSTGRRRIPLLTWHRKMATENLRILSERDNGLYDAMNKGAGNGQREICNLPLNAGDAFHSPDTLAAYAKAAEKDADIIYADTVIVDSERKMIAPRHLSAPRLLTFKSFAKDACVPPGFHGKKKTLHPNMTSPTVFGRL